MTQLTIDELEFLKKLLDTYKLGFKMSGHPDQIILDNYFNKANLSFMNRISDKLEIEILAK
jgi:hypothetical protein